MALNVPVRISAAMRVIGLGATGTSASAPQALAPVQQSSVALAPAM